MDRQISVPAQAPDKAYVLHTAVAWTDSLRMEGGLPTNPIQYEETTQRIASLYGLDYQTPTGRMITDQKIDQLTRLHAAVQLPGQYEQLAVDEGESDPYEHIPASAHHVAAEIVALTLGQAYDRQDVAFAHHEEVGYLRARMSRLRNRIASLKRDRQQLRRQVTHDALTDALNIRGEEEIEQRWLYEQAANPRVIVPFDATCFKEPNDVLGHAVGDQLLVEMVRELRSYTRQGDNIHIVRTGGDEFMMMVDRMSPEGFRSLVNRMQAVQLAKVADGKNVSIWNHIRSMQRKGPLEVEIVERAVPGEAQASPRRYLRIRGTEICDLRDLAILSIGGDRSPVASEADLLNMKTRAEKVLMAHKAELHKHMGGAYRIRRHASFIAQALQIAGRVMRRRQK